MTGCAYLSNLFHVEAGLHIRLVIRLKT